VCEAGAPDETDEAELIEMLIAKFVQPERMMDDLFDRFKATARKTLRSTACLAIDLFLINYHELAGKFIGGGACAATSHTVAHTDIQYSKPPSIQGHKPTSTEAHKHTSRQSHKRASTLDN